MRLRELSLFHTLTDIPVDEGTLGVHHVVLLGDTLGEDTADGDVISNHGDIALGLLHDVSLDLCGWNLVQANLESGWAPLDEGDLVVLLQPLDGGVGLLGLDLSSVVDGDGHVLVLHWVEVGVFHKHVLGLEHVVGDLADGLGLVRCLLLVDDGGKCGGHEVESREGHQVGLELSEVNVELSVESEGRSHGGDDLGDDHVQVSIAWAVNVQLLLADAIDSLVVKQHGHLGVIQQPMGGEHGVVGLHDTGGDLGGGVDLESNLGLLAVVNGNALEDERAKSGSGTTSDGVVDDESLDVLGVVNELAQAVVHLVEDLLSDGVVSTSEVVRGIFLSVQEELGVEHLGVSSGSDIVDDSWLEVNGDVSWDELAGAGLLEESGEVLVFALFNEFSAGVDLVFGTVLGPHGVTELDSSLSNIDGQNFTGWHV